MRKLLGHLAAVRTAARGLIARTQGAIGVSLVTAGTYVSLGLGPALLVAGGFFLLGALTGGGR
jgi:hypothetical protein